MLLGLVVTAMVFCLAAETGAADLAVEWRNGRWEPRTTRPTQQRVPQAPAPPYRPASRPVLASPPVPPGPAARTEVARAPTANERPRTAELAPNTTAWTHLIETFDVVVLMLTMLVVLLLLLSNWRQCLNAIDGLFEHNPSEGPTLHPLDVEDFGPSEVSAAEVRKQTEILRALKKQLDAELDAARRAVRRARTTSEGRNPERSES
ncbi:MAG: hypothetical protein IT539_04530 [Bradyrhizobiaceae bacterium]|nr:hypothetical protein [Bradyrhizobiaceae bacterium]